MSFTILDNRDKNELLELINSGVADGRSIVSIEKTITGFSVDGHVQDTYTITYTDGTTSDFTVTNGKDGKDGTSVGIAFISENLDDKTMSISSTDVIFTDGNKITITNGKDGTNGKTPVKGTDYWTDTDKQEVKSDIRSELITQEVGSSEKLTMSQKAITDLVAEALGNNETSEYETVDSIEEMTDKNKQYILSSTGTIWACTSTIGDVEHNAYDSTFTDGFNKRINSSGNVVSYNGSLLTDFIEQSYDTNCLVTIKGINALADNYSSYFVVDFFNESKTIIGQRVGSQFHSGGELPLSFNIFSPYTALEGIENTAYIRIKLGIKTTSSATDGAAVISAADCEGLVINFNTKNTTREVLRWADTGLSPSEDTNGNYLTLLVKVNKNAEAINELSARVTPLEIEAETLTIPTFWKTSVNSCIAKIKSLQSGRSCVTFPFFSDNHQRNGYSGVLIAHVMKQCHIPYCFYGGDSISSGTIASEEKMIEQDGLFDSMMSYIPNGRFCRAVGNHDGYWYDGTDRHYYSRDQVYELFLREESIAQNKHFGDDGTYYYVDELASKVRFVVLNTNGGSLDDTQFEWLKNTAMNFHESGWAVVFISHQPITNNYHCQISNAQTIQAWLSEYINGSATNKADIVGWFAGHIHRDRIYEYDFTGVGSSESYHTDDGGTTYYSLSTDDYPAYAGWTKEKLPWKTITVASDHTAISYDQDMKHSIGSDDQSHAIDFVTINRATREVTLTRLGSGSDRSYTY